jgi:hypothetical protein
MMPLQVGRVKLAGSSSVVTYQTTQHHIPEGSNLDINTSDNLPVTENWHCVLKMEKILLHRNATHQKKKQNWPWKMTWVLLCLLSLHPYTSHSTNSQSFNDHELCITKSSFQIFMMTMLLLADLQQFQGKINLSTFNVNSQTFQWPKVANANA